jgi:hypothetical protein
MTTAGFEKPAAQSRQLAFAQYSRSYWRWSYLSLTRDVLLAVALLAGIGAMLSIGLSGWDLMALR